MERWIGRVALVTGASSGIGAAVCRDLVKAGMNVVGVARNEDKLQTLEKELKPRNGTFTGMKCDVTKDDEILGVFKAIKGKFGGVDVCVNNAGLSIAHNLLDGSTSEWRTMTDTNVIAMCLCAKETFASLQERNLDTGHIINISSKLGHMVSPQYGFNFYAGTKHAVKAITEGLRQELREKQSHIRVSSISPGMVNTEFFARMQLPPEVLASRKSIKPLLAEDISREILHMLSVPPHVEINDIILRPTEQAP